MALPASMSSVVGIKGINEKPRTYSRMEDNVVKVKESTDNGIDNQQYEEGEKGNEDGGEKEGREEVELKSNEDESQGLLKGNSRPSSSSPAVEIDDDEVLRILSALEDEENENENENKDDNFESNDNNNDSNDDDDDDDDLSKLHLINPAKQLQQRLKGVYSKNQNKGGSGHNRGRDRGSDSGSKIGNDVFEVVDNNKRVKDIRKSKLSDPPVLKKQSIFSAPLTENVNKKTDKNKSENSKFTPRTVYLSDGNIKNSKVQNPSNNIAPMTVAEALAAVRDKPNSLRNIPKDPRNRDNFPMVTGAVFETNTGLRMLAESSVSNPFGGVVSYNEEEVDDAIR